MKNRKLEGHFERLERTLQFLYHTERERRIAIQNPSSEFEKRWANAKNPFVDIEDRRKQVINSLLQIRGQMGEDAPEYAPYIKGILEKYRKSQLLEKYSKKHIYWSKDKKEAVANRVLEQEGYSKFENKKERKRKIVDKDGFKTPKTFG